MYESPITLNFTEPIFEEVRNGIDEYCLRAIIRCGCDINKEELIKALEYDRGQYEKGYNDGKFNGYLDGIAQSENRNVILKEIKKVMLGICIYPSEGIARPVSNTTKRDCYNALYKIQELIKSAYKYEEET